MKKRSKIKTDSAEKAKNVKKIKKNASKPKSSAKEEKIAKVAKEMEQAMYALKFYPVAVNEKSKKDAIDKIEKAYKEGNETIKQLILYLVHENLAGSTELKIMHTREYFKMKRPSLEPTQQRMSVYRAIFNYNTSLEGLVELIRMLGRFHGDDAAKLLTYHYSFHCSAENEATHTLRGAIIEALGASESKYALLALLTYARYTDNERTLSRIVNALMEWEERLDKLKLDSKEKQEIEEKLKEIVTSEFRGNHYG